MTFELSKAAFAARREKSLAAAEAVYQVLEKRRPLQGREWAFLAHWQWLAARREVMNDVRCDPRFYHWARTAYSLLSAVLGGAASSPTIVAYMESIGTHDAGDALATHLDSFAGFVLGGAWRTHQAVQLASPVAVECPWSLPRSPWSIESDGVVILHAIDASPALDLTANGRRQRVALTGERYQPHDGFQLCRGPELTRGNQQIVLQPHAFHLPAMPTIGAVVQFGTEFQWRHLDRCKAAFGVIERYAPQIYDEIWDGMQLIGLKPEAEGMVYNTSASRLTGACILTAYDHPFVLAEDLIHEYHHNKLFAIEDQGVFFDNAAQDAVSEEAYYSPWREDPRPLYGLLHAFYVFTAVGHFWHRVYTAGENAGELERYAVSRLVRLQQQLSTVRAELSHYAAFTDFGREVYAQLLDSHQALSDLIEETAIPQDSPVMLPRVDGTFDYVFDNQGNHQTVREALASHIKEYDVYNRCGQLEVDSHPLRRIPMARH